MNWFFFCWVRSFLDNQFFHNFHENSIISFPRDVFCISSNEMISLIFLNSFFSIYSSLLITTTFQSNYHPAIISISISNFFVNELLPWFIFRLNSTYQIFFNSFSLSTRIITISILFAKDQITRHFLMGIKYINEIIMTWTFQWIEFCWLLNWVEWVFSIDFLV